MLKINPKEIKPGDTFLALKNKFEDGHDKIEEAIENGAACIIAEHGEYDVKTIITNDTRTYLSNYLKELYLEKLNKIKIIGIIGTQGKTTTGLITYQLLNNLEAKTSFITNEGLFIDNKLNDEKELIDIYEIYDYINKSIDNNCENIIIEISSEDIEQRKVEGIRFDVIIYTNYIPYSPKKEINEKYLNTKIEILKNLKKEGIAVINKKDNYYSLIALPQNHNIFYGTKDSDYQISNIGLTYDITEFDINNKHVEIPLLGSFNIYNYLASFATASALNYPYEAIINATEKLNQIDGIYQAIKHKSSLVIIDKAKDIMAISNIINITKEFRKARVITLIGLPGEENIDKRPLIGSYVTNNSDYVIFTSNSPRHEQPEDIIDDMLKEVQKDNYEIIVNRKEAIKKGIEMLSDGDILLILGKGNENYQIIDNDRFTYKDYNEVIKHTK